MKSKYYICYVPYLRNTIAYDYFWYPCVKWWYLQVFFFIFWKFWFFGLLVWNKGKKWPKMTKNYICCTLYLRNHTSYECHLWYTCVKWWYLQVFFFIFWKFWFFRLLVGNKGKKWPKMTRNYICCTLYLRNHTSYDCHLWYTCVKWYLQAFFSFCQNFDFLGF